jgi:hypothetical protein
MRDHGAGVVDERHRLPNGFASLDPAPTRKDPALMRKTGDEQETA